MALVVLAFSLLLLAGAASGASGFLCAGQSRLAASAAAKALSPAPQNAPSRGRLTGLLIAARFARESTDDTGPPAYARGLFDARQAGSLTHFFLTMSAGQLELGGQVLPRRYESRSGPRAYTTTTPGDWGRFGAFVEEVLVQADRDVDFSRFDSDGPDGAPDSGDDDGWVDYVWVTLPSVPEGFLVGRATGIVGLGLERPFDTGDRGASGLPIRISGSRGQGAIVEEGIFAQTTGAMAHEFGHSLGLPDLFDLDYGEPDQDSAGIGKWGLMGWGGHGWQGDDGPARMTAWSLERLGWLGPDNSRLSTVETDRRDLVVADLFDGGQVYRIPLPARFLGGARLGEEYLLVEYRRRGSVPYDRHAPADGALVWHVRPQFTTNNDESGKVLDLMCADGLYQDRGYPLGGSADAEQGRDNLDFWAHDAAYAGRHAGNLGDVTDPFDGVRYRRLDVSSNPSANPQRLSPPSASTGVALAFRREGARLLADADQPRWAGVIREPVCWGGSILLDGDLQVAPEGRVFIQPGTRVRVAGSDRLGVGRDPVRTELDVRGDLEIGQARSGLPVLPVVFEAEGAGDRWFGILIDPADSSRIVIPENSYQVRDADFGLLMPRAPRGLQGQVERRYLLTRRGATAAQLAPGDTFGVVLELDNWSLTVYQDVAVEVTWPGAPVRHLADPGLARARSTYGAFYPGRQVRLRLPTLVLAADARPGSQVRLTMDLRVGARRWRDAIDYDIRGEGPAPAPGAEAERPPPPVPAVQGQVLVILSPRYPEATRAALRQQLRDAVATRGLGIFIADDGAPASWYGALLDRYCEDGRAVLWLGNQMDEGVEAEFARFAAAGGRLLLASLNLARADGMAPFLRQTLGVGQVLPLQMGRFPDLIRYRPLRLEEGAQPFVRDAEGGVAGLWLERGAARLAYLSFDLQAAPAAARRRYLEESLSFLLEGRPPAVPATAGKSLAADAGPATLVSAPNPFNSETAIRFFLENPQDVELAVFDMAGQRLRTLVSGPRRAGEQLAAWDGRDGGGRAVASGTYILRLRLGPAATARRVTLLR